MQKIIEAKRATEKTPYHLIDSGSLSVGDRVVVDFDDFQTILTVSKVGIDLAHEKADELKSITRVASVDDIKRFEQLAATAKKQIPQIKKKSLELGLMMKFVSAEYSLDGSKILIVFSSEERVDFRQLLKELAVMLKTRIELKQIGQRDEIKVCGGVGPCGQPCCCARFLNNFEHVTVKMAKTQGLSLSPTKINGICGRLMCCLAYESETYEKMLENMPKVNSEVGTPNGKGIVVFNDILRERVSVKRQTENDTIVEDFALDEIGFNGRPAKKREEVKTDLHIGGLNESEKKDKFDEKFDKREKFDEKLNGSDNANSSSFGKDKNFKDKSKNFKDKGKDFDGKNRNASDKRNFKNEKGDFKNKNNSYGMEIVDVDDKQLEKDSKQNFDGGEQSAAGSHNFGKKHGHGKWSHHFKPKPKK